MLIKGKDLLNMKVVHQHTGKTNIELSSILLNKNDYSLCCLAFTEKALIEERKKEALNEPDNRLVENVIAATNGLGAANAGIPGRMPPIAGQEYVKETFYIPVDEIVSIDNVILYKGNERQTEETENCFPAGQLKNWEVEMADGEKIGKIKDIVFETRSMKAVGFELSEGFWSKLLGEGTKYMPLEGKVDWLNEKWIVSPVMKDQLVEEINDIPLKTR
ncbi:PRC-barrel domain-containing protein [Fictibacillus sp. Mic-4]|uniref:PRC-barrel domain-containing protein n=1 Tax=Fictibacillus sp. Mic-4 TaxID=3132826 RepID=UPI003CE9FAA5